MRTTLRASFVSNRFRPTVIGLALALTGMTGCARREAQPPPPPPNILFISVDTLRRDHLGCYGYGPDTSPNIDALARGGTIFDNAISSSSWTLPAHASMLTGLYPAFHGLQDDGVKLGPRIVTLAESLQAAGYHTIGVVSHVYVSSAFGLDRGFHTLDDSLIADGATNPVAEQVVDRFLELRSQAPPGKKVFAFVHFFDPHWDYSPPPPYDTRFVDPTYAGRVDGTLGSLLEFYAGDVRMPEADRRQAIALYDGEIAYLDAQIGRLLAALDTAGQLADTVIVFTADHGEEFKEHGQLGHARTLFGEQLRVPLLITGDARFAPQRREADLVSPVDIMPTLLEMAGVTAPAGLQGRSLLHPAKQPNRAVWAESIRFGQELRSAQVGQFKMIHYLQGDNRLFYDLARDPDERRPLQHDPTGGRLTSLLNAYAARADRGWHLKLISVSPGETLSFRGTIQTTGRLVNPRRYFSAHVGGPSKVEFARFELSPDRNSLTVEATLSVMIGELVFETDPPDAPVTFDITVSGTSADAGVFLGRGEPIDAGQPLTLKPTDPRLGGVPDAYATAPAGCYIRTVLPPSAGAPAARLTPEAIKRLKALGYIDTPDGDE